MSHDKPGFANSDFLLDRWGGGVEVPVFMWVGCWKTQTGMSRLLLKVIVPFDVSLRQGWLLWCCLVIGYKLEMFLYSLGRTWRLCS